MKCPKCKSWLEGGLEVSKTLTWMGQWCDRCEQAYDPSYGGTNEAVDLGGVKGTIKVLTLGQRLRVSVNGRELVLNRAQALKFCDAIEQFGGTIRGRVRGERIRRGKLNRWLLHRDGATFRSEWHGVHNVTLRETTPRRDWACSTCNRALLAGATHWLGERSKQWWGAPSTPRFCSACVHESRSVDASAPVVPKGLQLVEKAGQP